MVVRTCAVTVLLSLLLSAFSACSRDPNRRKQSYLNRGNAYLQKGRYSEAAIEFRNAVQLDPRFAEAHYQLAKAELQLKDWADAYKQLQATINLQPGNVAAQIDCGNVAIAVGDVEGARQIAFTLLQAHPANADAYALMANIARAHGNRDEALRQVEKAISLQPQRASLYLSRGTLLAELHRPEEAEGNLRKAAALDPTLAAAFTALAQLYAGEQRWPEAQNAMRRTVQLDATSAQARLVLARLYLAEENSNGAEQVLQQAVKDLPHDPQAGRILAEFYQSIGDNQKALAQFATTCREYPRDLPTSFEYAQLLLELNQADQARQVNEAALKQDGNNPGGRIIQSELLVRSGKPQEAITILQSVLRDDPENAFAHFQFGLALNQAGDQERAESEWRRAAELRPDLSSVQRRLGQLAAAKSDFELLAQVAQQLIAYHPQSPEGYLYRAVVAEHNQQPDNVEASLRRAFELAPRNSLVLSNLGDWRRTQKRYVDAEQFYEEALQADPNSTEALRGLVLLYTDQHQPAKALNRLQAQIARTPSNSNFFLILGDLQIHTQDLRGAEASLRQAVALNRNNVAAYYRLAQVQAQQSSLDQALATIYESLKFNPQDLRAYLLGGALQESNGNWRAAQDLYRRALQIHPGNPYAANNLAYSLLESAGDTDLALSLAQQAHRAAPNAPGISDTLAWAYYHKGLYRAALPLLQQALKADPRNSLYHYHAGMVYARTHDPARARAQLLQALQGSPSPPQAEMIRKQLRSLGG